MGVVMLVYDPAFVGSTQLASCVKTRDVFFEAWYHQLIDTDQLREALVLNAEWHGMKEVFDG